MFLRAFLCWLCLSASAAAQIDLPDRPVRPPPVTPTVEPPPLPKGDLADRVTGAAAAREAAQPPVDLPATAVPAPVSYTHLTLPTKA